MRPTLRPLAAALVLAGCAGPDADLDWVTRWDAVEPGDTAMVLYGGPLLAPLSVPLWLEYADDDDEDVEINLQPSAFELTDGRIYVAQHNIYSSQMDACRIFDPVERAWSDVAGECIHGEFASAAYPTALGEDWLMILTGAEGIGAVTYATWTPEDGQRDALTFTLGAVADAPEAYVDEGTVLIGTFCDLPDGCPLFEEPEGPWRTWTLEADGTLVED